MTSAVHSQRTDLADPSVNALTRFKALSQMFDVATKRYLSGCGLRQGWHCLEAGAGGGSIAVWLSKRVGSTGRVIATDVDTRFLQAEKAENLKVWRQYYL